MPENVTPAAPETPVAPPQEGAEPPAPPEGEPPVPPEPEKAPEKRRFALKVDGEDVEVDEDELKRGYSLSRASYKRLEEVASLRKQLEGFVGSFRKDPVATLRQLATEKEGGPAFKEAVEKYLLAEYEREKMDPKERALLDAQEKLRQAEEEKKGWAEKQREEKLATQQQAWAKHYDEAITEALASPEVALPKTPATVKRMAQLMRKSLDMGIDVDARDVAKLVREEYLSEQKEVLGGLQGDALLKYLGPDVAKRIREYEVAQLKRNQPGAVPPAKPAEPAAPKEPEPKRRLTERDFEERLARLARGEV